VRKSNEPLEGASEPTVKQKFWRNLAERDDFHSKPEAHHDEFLPETLDDSLPSTTITRRGFIGLIGAATALATAACSTREKTIVPYTKRPTEVIPGVANYYASTYPEGDCSFPVLVKTREGRPIHVVGNDESPRFKGKTSIRAIADIMGLYDPDRLRAPTVDGQLTNWETVEKKFSTIISAANRESKPILLLTGSTDSPTRKALLGELRNQVKSFDVRHWEPGRCEAARSADEAVFGVPLRKRLRLDRTNTIIAFSADFLGGDDPASIAAFTNKRRPAKPSDGMTRLWVFESRLSLTGANADHRFAVKPTDVATIAFALAFQLHTQKGFALPVGVNLPSFPEDRIEGLHIPKDLWQALVDELGQAKSDAVVVAGDDLPSEAQIAVHLLNEMLGSRGVELSSSDALLNSAEFEEIIREMENGRYHGVILWGVNPIYSFRDATRIRSAFEKVPNRIWIGTVLDESASLCQWQLPENHWLESWGDHASTGQLTLQQPAVMPLYDSRSGEDILLFALNSLGGDTFPDYHNFLLYRWRKDVYASDTPTTFEQFFNATLHDGVLHRELPVTPPPGFRGGAISEPAQAALTGKPNPDFELLIHVSTQLYDGRFANNAWLQELPDPVTKNTWGNPLLISVSDANRLGLANGDVVEIDSGQSKLSTPVLIQPGQAQGVFAIALGYGRTFGSVARNVGVNAYSLLGTDTSSPNVRRSVKLSKTSNKVRLPLTQSHHRMHGRDLVRMMTLSEFDTTTNSPRKQLDLVTLYPSQRFPEHKWGMVVDLSACIGCSACVIGCQSENNIPTVGAEQVERGREMHWIRIDSYYEGSEDNPRVVHQPMLCQHCDSAPCENVCPVNATNHSPDGLNQMAYNRCVGTRYCANNCPYKVRRYNFFDYTSEKPEPAKLVYNPEVTVRPRGVMEKCTFCVQKIEDARMRAKTEKRPVRDGEIVPACAAACPSSAIVFGDLNSATSQVSQASRNKRGYKVLEEVGARPAVTYLAALRNPVAPGGRNE
jgi:molybdopterin-containing oxidoreductase family iron-sulfur binding subunit